MVVLIFPAAREVRVEAEITVLNLLVNVLVLRLHVVLADFRVPVVVLHFVQLATGEAPASLLQCTRFILGVIERVSLPSFPAGAEPCVVAVEAIAIQLLVITLFLLGLLLTELSRRLEVEALLDQVVQPILDHLVILDLGR